MTSASSFRQSRSLTRSDMNRAVELRNKDLRIPAIEHSDMIAWDRNDAQLLGASMPTQVNTALLRTEQHHRDAQPGGRHLPDPGFTMKLDEHRSQVPPQTEDEVTAGPKTEQQKEPKHMTTRRPGNQRRGQYCFRDRPPVAIACQPTQC